MLRRIGHARVVKRIRKSLRYSRLRQRVAFHALQVTDDGSSLDRAEKVVLPWPDGVPKPRVGLVQDPGTTPRWTKYRRLLESNAIPYEIYDVHSSRWLERAREFDVVVGVPSCEPFDLEEIRRKYCLLEGSLGKVCYPSAAHLALYEDKMLEAYLCEVHNLPFVPTHISHDKDDALRMVDSLAYPVVSKIVPSSGSVGVELVRTPRHARHIVEEAFSPGGRKTHSLYHRQKNYVYFQDFVPNDGHDLRVILIGDTAQGNYRRALPGDFRASGMHLFDYGPVPEEAIRIARRVNDFVGSPHLAVDMVLGTDGRYRIVELSPITGVRPRPDDLTVDGVPGIYDLDADGNAHFRPGRFWTPELSLKQFFLDEYLPRVIAVNGSDGGRSSPRT